MKVADLIESPIPARQRPSELPAPATVDVRADDLEPGDVVAIGRRQTEIVVVLRRGSSSIRIRTADGSILALRPFDTVEVRRG